MDSFRTLAALRNLPARWQTALSVAGLFASMIAIAFLPGVIAFAGVVMLSTVWCVWLDRHPEH